MVRLTAYTMGVKMKRTELSAYNEKAEIQSLIEQKFEEWDNIFANGHDGLRFVPDGLLLNNLRNDIQQLRKRSERLFGADLAGQLTLFGGEVKPERPLPPLVPANWNAQNTLRTRQNQLEKHFGKLTTES